MSVRIYKEAYFEASHRLLHYNGKCFRLHGHQWRAEFWVEGDTTADSNILVDYNMIKEVVGRYDHQVILNTEDPMVECLSKFQEVVTTDGDPTSELMAERMAKEVEEECSKLGIAARVTKCRIWESTSCFAEWTP
ncbi:6-pyruvoyltetrahydropterin/6-carboxytetrahydropterin synthase [Methanomicrobium sp. W14]|jgi:6-pyruvoyltetrahydropterin/6-carboxytetrahydropterin synthase|uniref:6-carboxytetrahydropterin synthase n=1 Tax=Methanomicrobium sp. W14 TaxID=2817839 RepID=UPI001AEA90DF|nr:6-carboxytetrahydropterin synthase [Methanomicrobium sp. W14]MBP2133838.1 6-pyruvoyltetrahydropterin/6-carboxytetrahydropterin synthase [Methanomicrobium sp. W14]